MEFDIKHLDLLKFIGKNSTILHFTYYSMYFLGSNKINNFII